MRVDANVSVRPEGSDELRTRCELKNMNSFNFVAQGIERRDRAPDRGLRGRRRGRAGDLRLRRRQRHATPRRSKEEAEDYRYFPEPDLVPIEPPAELVERLRGELPECPARGSSGCEDELDFDRAVVLVTGGLDRLWRARSRRGRPARGCERDRERARRRRCRPCAVDPVELAKLIEARERIPRETLRRGDRQARRPGILRRADYLAQEAVADAAELEPIVDRVLAEYPGQVGAYRAGKEGLLGFFIGQVMKETGGKANARVVNDPVREKLLSLSP